MTESPLPLLDKNGQGLFITFEGLDGSGKTTQLHKAAEWLSSQGYPVVRTREPGGTEIGKKIRSLLLDPTHTNLIDQSELLLYLADRLQHLHENILPAKQMRQLVLCDRFHDATVAYQGYGRQLDLTGIQSIVEEWIAPHYPDFTVLLEISPEMAVQRIKQYRKEGDRLEQESLLFFERVAIGYKDLVKENPRRFICVDAIGSIEEVHQAIIAALSEQLGLKK